MASFTGKTVGRVGIRAIPDGTRFRADLKRVLQRAERTLTVTIPVAVDPRDAQATLQRFQRDWKGKKISLDAAVKTAAASTRLGVLARRRLVELVVEVRKSSIAKATSVLAAISGARVAGDLVKNLGERLQNLDRALPKMALVATSIGTIASAALSAVGGVFTLGSGLAQFLGTFAALPGILAGAAVGGLALGLALADIPTRLARLKPQFVALQNAVSDSFWAKARQPILDFVNSTLPEFRTGLVKTGSAVGSWASTVVGSIQAAFGGGRITAMFEPLLRSIAIAETGALGFAQAMAVLGQVGGSYLPRLAQWVADLSNRFGAYLLQIEASGRLVEVIDAGITAAKLLGSSLASLVSIWSGISDAAMAAGGGGLASFAATLATIATIVNSPAFQTTLTTILTGAAAGADGLAASLAPIGAMLSYLAPTLSGILSMSGQVFGTVLGQIAAALSQPEFAVGLTAFFAGIKDGLAGIAPSLPAIAKALGSLGTFAGRLAGVLGPVLGAVLEALAPAVTAILDALTPLLPVLGAGLIGIIGQLAPLLTGLVTTLLPPIVQLISALVPELGPIIESILPVVAQLLPVLAEALAALLPIILPLVQAMAPMYELLGMLLLPVLKEMVPMFDQLGDRLAVVSGILAGVFNSVVAIAVGLLTGDLPGALESLKKIWSDVWDSIGGKFEEIWESIASFGIDVMNNLVTAIAGFFNGVIGNLNGLVDGVNALLKGISDASGGTVSLQVPKIPKIPVPQLAVGGDILATRGGILARLGEGGQDERVINRGLGNRALELTNRLAQRALAAGQGGGSTNYWELNEVTDAEGTAIAVIRRQEQGEA